MKIMALVACKTKIPTLRTLPKQAPGLPPSRVPCPSILLALTSCPKPKTTQPLVEPSMTSATTELLKPVKKLANDLVLIGEIPLYTDFAEPKIVETLGERLVTWWSTTSSNG